MNYLLPVQIGAPDMANNNKSFIKFNIDNSNFYSYKSDDIKNSDPITIHNNNINIIKLIELAPYFCGLFEGDGHIWTPLKTHGPSGKKYSPRFNITFVMKDLPLANYFSALLGGVQIRIKTNENACVLTVNSLSKIIILVNILNGLFRTPKILQFNALIEWLNKNNNTNIIPKDIDNSKLSSNA